MKLRKITLVTLCIVTCFLSCKKDDDNDDIVVVELADRTEQEVIDNEAILEYLETHYYNSEEIKAIQYPSLSDLVITKLEEGEVPDGHTLFKKGEEYAVDKRTIDYLDTKYQYYVLKLNEGGGSDSPTFVDNVYVTYEGFTLDDVVFDSAVNPVKYDLLIDVKIEGWRRVLPEFNTAEDFIEKNDGTINFLNHGAGVMFIPSGLAYFSGSVSGNTYAPLIFKFELLETTQNDHDGDGIPTYLEDLNGDDQITVNYDDLTDETDDDTDGNGTADFLDNDDDGDGVSTINELERITYTVDTTLGEQEPVLDEKIEFEVERSDNNAGIITIKTLKIVDSNNNDVDDYLDKDVTTDYSK
ncbi:FKBP-type peptidyl-prolyl cis-trans isomerase [Flavivirga jejuensis]|uniref:Peptidylprolyl isomerase n=1 Tax=Flavivirga jejuensis TaxID=870487 RepID=A0ABT8WVE6_9FLAO|nr:hypothetical protein [Flavivirga jejuensis]MDO5977151.1 hypothetical protein [Flavivirga jejuensis]